MRKGFQVSVLLMARVVIGLSKHANRSLPTLNPSSQRGQANIRCKSGFSFSSKPRSPGPNSKSGAKVSKITCVSELGPNLQNLNSTLRPTESDASVPPTQLYTLLELSRLLLWAKWFGHPYSSRWLKCKLKDACYLIRMPTDLLATYNL